MKALILNGALKDGASLEGIRDIIATELRRLQWQVESLILSDVSIARCLGCFGCWVQSPGICIRDDAAREVASKSVTSDLLIFLTPVTFGGYSSELKKALDRSICIVAPFFMTVQGEIHHQPRYERYPRLMGVGVLPHPDEASQRIFETLVSRNAINFHSPAHAAGVVVSGQEPSTTRIHIQKLLAQVGVTP